MAKRIWIGIALTVALGTMAVTVTHRHHGDASPSSPTIADTSSATEDHTTMPTATAGTAMNDAPNQALKTQLIDYAAQRRRLSESDRKQQAENLIAELEQTAAQGKTDPQEAASMVELLLKDAESDPQQQEQRYADIRARLREMSSPPLALSPERQRQDQAYGERSRKIIEEALATAKDTPQQQALIQIRLQSLRQEIYGVNDPTRHASLFESH